jgi:hypothetical protein
MRPIKVAQTEGNLALVDEGLKPGAVVVDGQYKLRARMLTDDATTFAPNTALQMDKLPKRRAQESREHFRTVHSPTRGDLAADGGRDLAGNTATNCCRSQRSRQSIFRQSKSTYYPGASADVMVSAIPRRWSVSLARLRDWHR